MKAFLPTIGNNLPSNKLDWLTTLIVKNITSMRDIAQSLEGETTKI
jgi:hypothetical protein